MIPVTATIQIDEREVEEHFIRASGPGGQNVNKVATAVQLRFDAGRSASLPEPVRQRLMKLAGSRLTQDGVIVITAQRFRTQEANRRDARDRLTALIARAAEPRAPRKATRPPLASRRRRLEGKARRADVKVLRGRPGSDD